jgi:hypothetical protein
MSREGEARLAYGELIGALFGKRRLAARNIARGRAPEDTSKQGGIALNRSRKELRSRLHSPQSAAGIKGESGEWGKSSAAQPASGAGVKRYEGRRRNRRGFSPRDLEAGPGDKTAPENPGPEWINLGGFLLLRGVLFSAGLTRAGDALDLLAFLGLDCFG